MMWAVVLVLVLVVVVVVVVVLVLVLMLMLVVMVVVVVVVVMVMMMMMVVVVMMMDDGSYDLLLPRARSAHTASSSRKTTDDEVATTFSFPAREARIQLLFSQTTDDEVGELRSPRPPPS